MVPVILHTTNAVTARALRPPNRMARSLRGDDLPLNACQQPLRFGQGQTHVGDIDEIIGPSDLQDVRARLLTFSPDFHQPHQPSHASTLGQRTNAKITNWPLHPQTCDSPAFKWVNTALGNTKAAITGTYRAINSKHVPRYLAEFEYRFNRRYDLAAMIPRLCWAGVRTAPMPYQLLKLAEVYA